MIQLTEIQKVFFQQIKDKLPPNISFVHDISEILEISYDSAYRRIRGEKALSFEELFTLSMNYGISLDTLFNVQSHNVIFNCHAIDPEKLTIKDWLYTVLENMKMIKMSKTKDIIYAAKDPPVFHYWQFPEIGAFKTFLWEKTLLQFPEYEEKLFSLDDYDPEIQKTGEQILAIAATVPVTEIWNEDTFNITLRQMEYYWVSGLFKKKDDVLLLCDRVEKWVRHIQKQVEKGFKFRYGETPEGLPDSYKFYVNDVVLNDNTILVKTDNVTGCFLTFNVLSLLYTTNPYFTGHIEKYFTGLLQKSTLISGTSAKERNRFFNKLLSKIDEFKARM